MELTTISQPSPPIPAPPRNWVAPLASVYALLHTSHYLIQVSVLMGGCLFFSKCLTV